MENKKLFVCPICKTFYSSTTEVAARGCPQCKCGIEAVSIPYEEFINMSNTEKAAFKAEYIQKHLPKNDNENRKFAPTQEEYLEELPVSGWIKGLRAISLIIFVLFIIAAIYVFMVSTMNANSNPVMGLLTGGLVLLVGFLLVASTMVFLDVAQDIRAIRNKIENRK